MRTKSVVRTINTICGKTISYLQVDGQVSKMHSVDGPALIYAEEDKAPEYYLYGIRYSKAEWKERLTQKKAIPTTDISFNSQF